MVRKGQQEDAQEVLKNSETWRKELSVYKMATLEGKGKRASGTERDGFHKARRGKTGAPKRESQDGGRDMWGKGNPFFNLILIG